MDQEKRKNSDILDEKSRLVLTKIGRLYPTFTYRIKGTKWGVTVSPVLKGPSFGNSEPRDSCDTSTRRGIRYHLR